MASMVLGRLSSVHLASIVPAAVVIGITCYLFHSFVYNLFLHPLRSYPGPILWRVTRLMWDYYAYAGTLSQEIEKLHVQYGEIVRIAPDELSYNTADAWRDIFAHQPGKEEMPKDPMYQNRTPNGIPSILAADKGNHARYRRLLAHAFSEKGLRDQTDLIMHYVNLLIKRLDETAHTGEVIDIVSWYNMTVFDVIGDLSWGASFDCLRNKRIHEWIPAISASVKFVTLGGILRRHGLDFLMPVLIPKTIQEKRVVNYKFATNRVRERMEHKAPRGDFWDRIAIKSSNENPEDGMSEGEMVNNASVLVLGGSETSATALSGATYLLLTHPKVRQTLLDEVRTMFNSSEDINLVSVGRLKYLSAVLEETMRLYPPVPVQGARKTPGSGATIIGKFVPPNTTINVSMLSANRSDGNFYKPTAFIPERWLDDAPAEFASDDKAAMQVFSIGTRNCIGRNLAYAEMRAILAQVMWHFDMELEAERTGDWFDQKAWGIWTKKPLYLKLNVAKH